MNSLSKRDEVRGSKKTGAVSVRAADRIDHRANGAFAIRPGDVDNVAVAKIDL
jgi:hypothetical protein